MGLRERTTCERQLIGQSQGTTCERGIRWVCQAPTAHAFDSHPQLQLLDFQTSFYGNLNTAVTPFAAHTYEGALYVLQVAVHALL